MERLQEPTRVLEPRLDLTLWSVARASAEKLVTLPLDCAFYVLSGVESVLSEILLSAGRPTPSQCATLELTHRLKEVRDREAGLLKETGTYRDQLARVHKEKEALERRVHEASEQRDQAITDRAWLSLSLRALLRHAAIFALGVACAYTAMRLDWTHIWSAPAHTGSAV